MSLTTVVRSRCAAWLVVLAWTLPVLGGCSDSTQPVRPPAGRPTEPPATPPTPAPPVFPSLTRSGRIYAPPSDPYAPYAAFHNGTVASRYVLYADSSFGLQFVSGRFGFFEYAGRFTRVDSGIIFTWSGASDLAPGATGTLRGDTLSVIYSESMQQSDFINGTYVLSPAAR